MGHRPLTSNGYSDTDRKAKSNRDTYSNRRVKRDANGDTGSDANPRPYRYADSRLGG